MEYTSGFAPYAKIYDTKQQQWNFVKPEKRPQRDRFLFLAVLPQVNRPGHNKSFFSVLMLEPFSFHPVKSDIVFITNLTYKLRIKTRF